MATPAQPSFLYDRVLPRVELIGWLISALGLGLYYVTGPKANVILVVGLMNLALVYFLRAFVPQPPSPGESSGATYAPAAPKPVFEQAVLSKIQGIASAVTLIGILFKLLFFPGSATMLPVGVASLIVATIIQLATGQLVRPAAIIALLGAGVWAIPTADLVHRVYGHNPVLAEKMIYSQEHPGDRAAAAEVHQLQQQDRQRAKASH